MLTDDHAASGTVTISIDGEARTVPEGVSVAAALLGQEGNRAFCRSKPEDPAGSEPRSAFCLMGVCFDCLAEIDGLPDRQSCLIPVREGMVIRRQNGNHTAPATACLPEDGDGHV